jgi:class 3 adenylate cyclase
LNSLAPAVKSVIERFSGSIICYPMDEFIALWADADRQSGVQAHLATIELIRTFLQRLHGDLNDKPFQLPFSIGLCHGECGVQKRDDKYVDVAGDVVNRAMRLCQKAKKLRIPALADGSMLKFNAPVRYDEVEPDTYSLRVEND